MPIRPPPIRGLRVVTTAGVDTRDSPAYGTLYAMQRLHLEVWIDGGWQQVTLLDGKKRTWRPPKDGDTDDNLSRGLESFLAEHPEAFWLETPANSHGVYFGSGVPRLFRLARPR